MRCTGNLPEAFQQAIGILAKRWTPLILYVLSDGPRRFSEIAAEIEFVSDRVLSDRLKELEAEGLIERTVYPEVPVRVEYTLTEMGRDLQPVFGAIGKWANRWLAKGEADHECSGDIGNTGNMGDTRHTADTSRSRTAEKAEVAR